MPTPVKSAFSVEGEGEPIFLIHGIGASRASFAGLVPWLKNEYRVISYDLRGHGASPTPKPPYTLDDLVEEVGVDAARYTLSRYPADSPLTLDLEEMTRATNDNPVFYVQYAHARICSILRKAAAEGLAPAADHLDLLTADDLTLIKQAAQFPREVEAAARAREPHRIAFYLYDLAAAFHAFWNLGNDNPALRVIVAQDAGLSAARLYLVSQIGQVIRNGLGILGVEAVEEL